MIEEQDFLSEEHAQRIKDFTLYANFIANEFDIQVVLDTHHAHTDGKTISLPNVTNLSDEELDAMYAILLHEAGHIRYSDFSEKYFSRLKTHLHAFLANCFEDARIENLLCKDFDGAKNIFENLYTKHAMNPEINKRLFGFSERNGDNAFLFGAAMHNIKCNFQTVDASLIDPSAKKVIKVLSANTQFLQQIAAAPLVTSEDTLALADIAYNFFIANFKDSTEEISFKKDQEILDKLNKEFNELSNRTATLEQEYEASRKERLTKHKAYKEAIADIEDEVNATTYLQKSIDNVVDMINNIQGSCNNAENNAGSAKSYKNMADRALVNKQKIIDRMNRRIANYEKAVANKSQKDTTVPTELGFKSAEELLKDNSLLDKVDRTSVGSEEFDGRLTNTLSSLKSDLNEIAQKDETFNQKTTRSNNALQDMKSNAERAEKLLNDLRKEIAAKQSQLNNNGISNQKIQETMRELKERVDYVNSPELMNQTADNNSAEAEEQANQEGQSSDGQSEDSQAEGKQSSGSHGDAQNSQSGGSQSGQSEGSQAQSGQSSGEQQMRELSQQLQKKVEELVAPYKQLKEEFSAARDAENKALEQLNTKLMEAFNNIHNIQQNGQNKGHDSMVPFQNPLDILFEETDGWEASDEFQREFDKQATQETGQFVVNGQKLAGTGSGKRSVSVLLSEMKDKIVEINLSDCFKDVVAGSLLEQNNEAGFENFGNDKGKSGNTESYVAKLAKVGRHTVFTTEYDKIELRNVGKNKENEALKLLQDRQAIVSRLKDEMRKKMKFSKKPRFVGSKDEGDLDSRNLWKIAAKHGSDVFEQNNPKMVNKVAASVLVDISGSLNNDNTAEGRELKFVATALAESLNSCYVQNEVLGFHAPYSPELASLNIDASYNRRQHYVETVVFKNFNQKGVEGIDNLEVQSSENSDGESLRIAVKRLSKQRARNRVLFMVTDAKPFMSGSNILKLDKDFIEALNEAKRKKVQVVGIGFNADKNGIFGDNYIQVTSNDYKDLIDGISKIKLKVD